MLIDFSGRITNGIRYCGILESHRYDKVALITNLMNHKSIWLNACYTIY